MPMLCSAATYRRFIDEMVGRRNARNRKRIEIERAARRLYVGEPRATGPPLPYNAP